MDLNRPFNRNGFPGSQNFVVVLSQPQGHHVAVVRLATRPQCGCGPFSPATRRATTWLASLLERKTTVWLRRDSSSRHAARWLAPGHFHSDVSISTTRRGVALGRLQPYDSDIQIIPMDAGQKNTVCALCAMWPSNRWIPFGDHPLKLERYRED